MSNEMIDEETDNNFEKAIELFTIPDIPETCRFWMIRSKRGVFYNEFIQSGFIAIGWNIIDENSIESEKEDKLKENIKERYGDRVPGTAYNKCHNFIYEVSSGDIAMIVSQDKICFATVGKYYENTDGCSVAKEIEANKLIEDHYDRSMNISCPYKKRRKITVIKEIDEERLSPYLYKPMVANRHSLSSIDSYGNLILSSCYGIFSRNKELTLSYKIMQDNGINPKELSEFMGSMFDILSDWGKYSVEIKINAHSIGDVIFSIQNAWNQLPAWNQFLIIYMVTLGGEIDIKGCKLKCPSIANLVKWIYNRKHENNMKKHDEKLKKLSVEEKEEQVKSLKIQNERDLIMLEKESTQATKSLQTARNSSEHLNIVSVNFADLNSQSHKNKMDDKT